MSFPLLPFSWARYRTTYRTATAAAIPTPTSPGYHTPSILGMGAFVPGATFNPPNGAGEASFVPVQYGKRFGFVMAILGTAPPPPIP